MANDLDRLEELQRTDQGLAVVATTRPDGSVQASVVNCGILDHPVSGERVVAWASRSGTVKLANLRRAPRATVTLRRGWRWATVEGAVALVGPDDRLEGFADDALPGLHRAVFRAAGGSHDDWDEFDRTMVAEARAVVLVTPEKTYGQ
jgi:PPOX class probable F420-dependent enzyme